jgi:hypothetical protein
VGQAKRGYANDVLPIRYSHFHSHDCAQYLMSQINPRLSSVGGTQSPPPDDCHPMGACSIEGGNVGGIPDRQQRSRTSRQFTLEPYHNFTHQNILIRPSMCRNQQLKLKSDQGTPSHKAPPRAPAKTHNRWVLTIFSLHTGYGQHQCPANSLLVLPCLIHARLLV